MRKEDRNNDLRSPVNWAQGNEHTGKQIHHPVSDTGQHWVSGDSERYQDTDNRQSVPLHVIKNGWGIVPAVNSFQILYLVPSISSTVALVRKSSVTHLSLKNVIVLNHRIVFFGRDL